MKHGLFVQWVSHSHRGSARLWGSLGEDNGKKLEATMVVPIGCVKVCWTSHVEVLWQCGFHATPHGVTVRWWSSTSLGVIARCLRCF